MIGGSQVREFFDRSILVMEYRTMSWFRGFSFNLGFTLRAASTCKTKQLAPVKFIIPIPHLLSMSTLCEREEYTYWASTVHTVHNKLMYHTFKTSPLHPITEIK